MLDLLKRYRELLVVAALLAAPLVVYFAHAKRTEDLNRFDRVVLAVTGPIEKVVGWAVSGVSGAWDGYVSLRHSHERARELSRELNVARLALDQAEEATRENDRLKKLLLVKDDEPARGYLGARVVGVRQSPLGAQTVTIDRGSDEGVRKMMPVVTREGAVGRIQAVNKWTSEVLLLTDRNSSVAVRVERSRARANVRGLAQNDLLWLEHALRSDDMMENDKFVTSGTDGVFPRGVPVGRATRVGKAERGATHEQGLYQSAFVVPFVDVTKLEEVLVITSIEPRDGGEGPTADVKAGREEPPKLRTPEPKPR